MRYEKSMPIGILRIVIQSTMICRTKMIFMAWMSTLMIVNQIILSASENPSKTTLSKYKKNTS